MKREDLHGFVPAIVTPFAADGAIMEGAFVELARHLAGRGATAICVAGDNGESWSLSAAERGRLVRLAKDALGPGFPILAGISAPTMASATSYIRAAEENGADALLSMPQTYVLKATDAELMRRFEQITATTRLPLVLYNSPRRMGFELSVNQIERLVGAFDIIGLKESHRDFFHHSHLLHRMADRISVMTGPCHYILPAFALGARGFIATGPEFISTPPSRLAALGANAPDAEWRRAHHQLTVIYELLMGTATWPAAFKAALNLIGLPAGVPRDPVFPASEADIEKIRRCFGELGIETQ
jgi:4-hydroxy-tetrahydrodipicolinate synthase